MMGIPGWLRWISPWVALGLAAALAYVLLKPAPEAISQAPAPPLPAPGLQPEPASAPAHATEFVSYADAVDATAPAVVNIFTERRVVVPNTSGLPPQFAQLFEIDEILGATRRPLRPLESRGRQHLNTEAVKFHF